MFKKFLVSVLFCLATISSAFAIDVNQAGSEELTSIKGIGPATAAQIIKERDANGRFSDPEDLAKRVRGIGSKLAQRFINGGLTFGKL